MFMCNLMFHGLFCLRQKTTDKQKISQAKVSVQFSTQSSQISAFNLISFNRRVYHLLLKSIYLKGFLTLLRLTQQQKRDFLFFHTSKQLRLQFYTYFSRSTMYLYFSVYMHRIIKLFFFKSQCHFTFYYYRKS